MFSVAQLKLACCSLVASALAAARAHSLAALHRLCLHNVQNIPLVCISGLMESCAMQQTVGSPTFAHAAAGHAHDHLLAASQTLVLLLALAI